jgi:serine/threonine-protein kinase RsbW
MHLILSVCLPRDRASIPLTRHIIRDALREVGVTDACAYDVAIAQSEACTNVIDHSGPGDQYEVRVEVDGARCVISVIDTGHGFDESSIAEGADADSERGRGIQLMRALVDEVHFQSDPDSGTAVHLEKALHFRDDSVFRRVATGPGQHGD